MTHQDLEDVFIAGVYALKPRPCVKIPFEALATSLIFQEPTKHLHYILMMSDIRHHTIPDEMDPATYKRGALYHWTKSRVLEIKLAHDLTYGESNFTAKGGGPGLPTSKTGGCLGLTLAFIGLSGSFGLAVSYLYFYN